MDEDATRSEAGGTENGKSFDQRLREARLRQGLDEDPKPTGRTAEDRAKQDASALSIFFRVGVELLSTLLVGLAIGWGLDHVLHTRPLFLILFVLLGGVAGMFNVWRLVAPAPNPGRKS